MRKWALSSIFVGLLFAPSAAADPVLPVPSDPYGGGGIYGETSPYAQGPNPGAALPQPGLISGTVPGSNAPLATELSTGTSGVRPGTNALVPGSLSHNPAPDFPDNYFQGPAQSLPGQPPPKVTPALTQPAPDHKWGPIAQGGDSNPEDPENTESAPDASMARQLEPEAGEEEDEPTGDQSFASQLNSDDDE
ncbi:conserved hypothetical protein [Segniliparus rotundus DSM 44985]|uniref:Uncharacterized protein n=1 Tax=Segniliparus rotundus (strain ATCC BAA-972 / CDC 1076 / CIP 108378 / DSM 44985 / JCM 13578) TaxID=640132 RepID=D6Z9R1_SEGRD|nr:conserved hypothetical protein [Segniliparus rotundus DSM 44985]